MSTILTAGKSIIYNPFFWTTVFALIVNYLLYRINKKTFKLLYEKPHIRIKNISIATRHSSPDGMIPDGTRIDMEVINPSSFQNLLLSRKVSFFPFLTSVLENDADIPILPFSRRPFPIMLESTPFDKYKNKLAKIVLVDIKGRKITKYCLIK